MESGSVQPAVEGQGAEGAELDSSLYPGLDDVPSEYRQHIDPILKEVSSNANKKIEDINGKLKTWEPYQNIRVGDEEISVSDLDPELVNDLIQFAKITENEDAFKEWWEAVGNDNEWMPEEVDDEGFEDEDDEGLTAEQLQEIIGGAIEERMQPLLADRQEQAQTQALQEADNEIGDTLATLKSEHGDFDEEAEKNICKLALAYEGEPAGEAIKKGFADFNSIRTGAETGLFEQKSNQPSKPEGPGPANTTREKVTDFKDAGKMAMERLQAEQSS